MKSILYIGMDVHKNTYSLCAYNQTTKEFIAETRCVAEVKMIKIFIENVKNQYLALYGEIDVDVKTGYEAGCLGYSLYKQLRAENIDCDILAPTTMYRSSKNKVNKNDKLDARNIATNLANGTYKAVYVPQEDDVEVKEYMRMINDFKLELKKVKQHMNAFTLRLGHKYDGKSRWTEAHINWMNKLELTEMNREILNEYLYEYDRLKDKIERFKERIVGISQSEKYKEPIGQLRCLKGIDTASAMAMHVEISDFNRFPNAKAFSSYLGLTPGESSSGDTVIYTSITKQGNKGLRNLLVECVQALVKGNIGKKSKAVKIRQKGQDEKIIEYADKAVERLQRKYHKMIYRGVARNKAITAIARELACFIWGMETGNVYR